MKFKKKPVVIEAEQFLPAEGRFPAGVVAAPGAGGVHLPPDACGVETLEGFMRCNPGDWIITGVKGEKYPCKPDIFEATYEPAEEVTIQT